MFPEGEYPRSKMETTKVFQFYGLNLDDWTKIALDQDLPPSKTVRSHWFQAREYSLIIICDGETGYRFDDHWKPRRARSATA